MIPQNPYGKGPCVKLSGSLDTSSIVQTKSLDEVLKTDVLKILLLEVRRFECSVRQKSAHRTETKRY